jgi:hypothetical protein
MKEKKNHVDFGVHLLSEQVKLSDSTWVLSVRKLKLISLSVQKYLGWSSLDLPL